MIKIYTKSEIRERSFVKGTRVPKGDIRVEAYETMDEFNSFVGLLSAYAEGPLRGGNLEETFSVGEYFADEYAILSSISYGISGLEKLIDNILSQLEPLENLYCLERVRRSACARYVERYADEPKVA